MAATNSGTATQFFENQRENQSGDVSREEIKAAIAKTVELRAIRAALMQGNSPANLSFPSASPAPLSASLFPAHDYPVFTPSYEDEPLPGHLQDPTKSWTLTETWDEYNLGGNGDETVLSDYKKDTSSSRKGFFPPDFSNLDSHFCLDDHDHKPTTGSSANHITVLQTSPRNTYLKSARRNSMGDLKSVSSCNRCKHATITKELENATTKFKNSNSVMPLTDSHSSIQPQPKNRGMIAWLFPRLKKKHKNEDSPNRADPNETCRIIKDLGLMPIETLKKELIEANESRDAALTEVSEMKTSLGELKQKLEYLETYCEELKKALKQATNTRDIHKIINVNKSGKSIDENEENSMPVTEEVMVEGFMQIISEARLSVRQFCKILLNQLEETDATLIENLNLLLQPYKLSLNSKYSKAVLYHVEGIINQSFYQDFENCIFQNNGSPTILDPQQDRQARFLSFVALRNLSWNEVLGKGTKYYSEEFSKFCDQKMSCIIATLNWTRPWPEQLLEAFFVAAKCIWLLHLLAFSFNPPLGILRVEENRNFDEHYMEDLFMERQRANSKSRVKIMVMPGFYVRDRVLKCKVLCRYKPVP